MFNPGHYYCSLKYNPADGREKGITGKVHISNLNE